MEGEVRGRRSERGLVASFSWALISILSAFCFAQEKVPSGDQPEISLRKSVNTRRYQGRDVEGEERQIGRGDTLWRILVEEKGVTGKQFRSYVVIIRGLNPQIKNLDVLRVGDKIFIPLQPDQVFAGKPTTDSAASERIQTGTGLTTNYRVKQGEYLFQILRDQLKLSEDRRVAQYYALVKDLNPERKNWDTLVEGEIIRLPVVGQVVEVPVTPVRPAISARTHGDTKTVVEAKSAIEPKASTETKPIVETKAEMTAKAPVPIDRRQALRAPARENLALFAKVAEAMGGQLQQSGEEIITMKDSAVRFDKKSYPVVFSPALGQRVVLDPEDKIPPSLRSKLGDPSIGTAIIPMADGLSVQDAISRLLSGLGYQALPTDRPVIIQEEGIAYEAKGNWMALAPEMSNQPQEIFVINLTEDTAEVPEYLKSQLANKGLHLRDVLLSPTGASSASESKNETKDLLRQVKTWPRDKKEIVDSLLFSFGISFGVAQTLSVELQSGLRLETRTDRLFELSGKRTALFFQRSDAEIRKALQDKDGVRTIDLEIASLSSRELITRLLNLLGDQVAYREHRFAAATGSAQDRLTVTAWGFHVPKRSLFITDRRIPTALHRFFFERGLEIVYFQ